MIFVAVGTQGSFDRLIRPIDAWAIENDRDDVFAQIGRDAWHPSRVKWAEQLDAPEFRRCVERAELVIAHAGMGTILTAIELGKPVLVMPRRAALGEQRNDHQVATARKLGELGLVAVADDERELATCLGDLDRLKATNSRRAGELDRLLRTLRGFLGVVTPR